MKVAKRKIPCSDEAATAVRTETEPFQKKKILTTSAKSLMGKRVCLTGTLTRPRAVVIAALEAAGAIVSSGISKNIDIVVAGTDAGSKLVRAQELGLTVWNETELNGALD